MTMPFGRYTGLDALPDAYLNWLTALDLRPPLSDAVRREAKRRRTSVKPGPHVVSLPARYLKIPQSELQTGAAAHRCRSPRSGTEVRPCGGRRSNSRREQQKDREQPE
jgi:hypothetical protein